MNFFSLRLNLRHTLLILTGSLALLTFPSSAQQIAFPGAEGYGQFTTGGRGGAVIEVTNLNDSGEGSLRQAIETSGARTVVFRVSGTIELQSDLSISHGDLTIAGQTAPGDGICLRNYTVYVGAGNVIIRYLRFRLGDVFAQESDAIWGRNQKNIIIDHCSMSWSTDETASFYDNENFTMQWCLVSESLFNSVHGKGEHGYGGIWGGQGATFHHNLLAHHTSRNPRFNGSRYSGAPEKEVVDFVNNVVYNWGFNSAYGGEGGNQNIRANYYKFGPATSSSKKNRIIEPSDTAGNWYVADNYVYGYPNVTADNWNGGVQGSYVVYQKSKNITVPFPISPVNTHTAEEAYQLVLENAGAILPKRDPLDARIIEEVKNGSATFGASYGTGSGIIDTQNDVGGWPQLFSAPAPVDTDHDGMPDEWEQSNGFDWQNPEDRNGDIDSDGFTNLEEYLNGIVQVNTNYILQPTNLTAELIGTNSVQLNWADNSDNEIGFKIERASDSEYSVIAEPGSDITSFLDENLADYTTYKYRVTAYNDSLISAYSNIAELTTSSKQAPPEISLPKFPLDKATFASLHMRLKWQPGKNAFSHNVYFGETNPPEFAGSTTDSFYVVQSLEERKKYYWRVDEVNDFGTTEGTVFSFTTVYDLQDLRIAYWKLDDGQGVNILDAGGFKNNGYLEMMNDNPWVTGISGRALLFDGIDGRAVIENYGLIDFSTESFTVSMWIKVNQFSGESMYLLSKGAFLENDTLGTNGKWYGFEIKGDQLRFSIDDNLNKTTVSITGAQELLGGKWNHIAGVRDMSNNQIILYVNGRAVSSAQDVTSDISNMENTLLGNSNSFTTPYNGILDEIKMYNYALSADEVIKITNEFITDVDTESIPKSHEIYAVNYPNPFNPATTIVYNLPKETHVKLEVFDLLGRLITTLVNDKQNAGQHSVLFNSLSAPGGRALTSGLYIYRLTTPAKTISQKMTLMK